MRLGYILSCFSIAYAFKNTAPVYIKGDGVTSLPRYMELLAVQEKIDLLALPAVLHVDKQLHEQLIKNEQFKQFAKSATVSEKVFFDGESLKLHANMLSVDTVEGVVKVLEHQNPNMVIQFLPSLESFLVQDKLSVRDLGDEASEIDSKKISDDLNDLFDKLVADAEAEGGYVTIQDHGKTVSGSSNSTYEEIVVTGGSIFDTYQLFSNGILSGLIVSLILIWVLLHGISWVSELQVSYRALEKQITPHKKNQ